MRHPHEPEQSLSDMERRIAGGDRRRRWFVGSLLVVGVGAWIPAVYMWNMCRTPGVNCAPVAGVDTGYDVMIYFAGFGTLAIVVALFVLFGWDRRKASGW